MVELVGALLGTFGTLLIAGGFIAMILLGCWWPVMVIRALRDLRQIRVEFGRLNDTLERQQSYPAVSKPNGRDEHAAVSGPTYTTRTGPLGRL